MSTGRKECGNPVPGNPVAEGKTAATTGSFLKHSAIYGIGSILIQASGFVLLPLYTRFLNLSDFGIMEILDRTGNFFLISLLANGFSTAAFSFYCQAKSQSEKVKAASSVTLATGLAAGIGILIVYLTRGLIGEFLKIEDLALVVWGMTACFCQLLPNIQVTLMQARIQAIRFIVTNLLLMVCRVGSILVALTLLESGLYGVFIATTAVALVFGFTLIVWEFRTVGFHPDRKVLWQITKYAWPIAPTGIVSFLLFNADRFFLIKSIGADELGLYAISTKIAGIVGTLAFQPFFKVWSARLYDVYGSKNSDREVGKWFTSLLFPIVFAGSALSLFSSEAVHLLATKAYHSSWIWVPVIILANLFVSVQVLLDGAFYAKRNTTPKIFVSLISTSISLLLYWLLIPRWGIAGAAVSSLLAMTMLAAITFLFAQRVAFVQFEWRRLALLLGSAGIVVLPAYILEIGLIGAAIKTAVLVIWPVALWRIGYFSQRESALALRSLTLFRTRVSSLGWPMRGGRKNV